NDLADVIVGVFGLDNRTVARRNGNDPPGTAPLTTAQVTQLYNFPSNSAAGQTIGIISVNDGVANMGGYLASDISSAFGGSPPGVADAAVDGVTNSGSADGETPQDICIAALAAPGAAVAVYFPSGSQQGWVDALNKVAHPAGTDPHCSVVSS